MKKIIFAGLWLFPQLMYGQAEGIIQYETRSSASISANGIMQVMPTRVTKNELLFSPGKSLFRNIPSTEEPQQFQGAGGSSIGFVVDNSLRVQYHDYDKKERLSTHELGDKDYIQFGSLPDLKWVLMDETKTVLNHSCKKAKGTLVRKGWGVHSKNGIVDVSPEIDTLTVYAWFAPDIPSPIGPDKYIGLPGAVLRVENKSGKALFEAVSISEKVKLKDIQPPSKGKLVSEEDFEKIDRDFREKKSRAMNGLN